MDDQQHSLGGQLRSHLAAWQAAGVEFVPRLPEKALLEYRDTLPRPPAPPADPAIARRNSLQMLATEVATCEACPGLFATRTRTVFGEGPLNPRLCVIGPAPSDADDETGRPFDGETGSLLDKILQAIGLAGADVYLLNLVKCKTPGRPPRDAELASCRGFLDRQLQTVAPAAILCLGELTARSLLGINDEWSTIRGRVLRHGEVPVFSTYHPDQLTRSPGLKSACWKDLQMLMRELGLTNSG